MPPILEPAKDDPNSAGPFVARFVGFYGFRSLFPARDAREYPFVFQGLSEPVGVVSSVPEQPIDIMQVSQQPPWSGVIADLPGSDEQVERAAFAVDDGKLGVHPAFGSANQANTSPFSRPCWPLF